MEAETKIKTASVKVMLSYDYSHFETSMSIENENGLSMKDIDEARKNCQRLSDKAVSQYKTAKDKFARRENIKFEMDNFESKCKMIEFHCDYDYEDDENYQDWN